MVRSCSLWHFTAWSLGRPCLCALWNTGPALSFILYPLLKHLTQSSTHSRYSETLFNILKHEELQLIFTTWTWFRLQNYCIHLTNCTLKIQWAQTESSLLLEDGAWKDCFVNSTMYMDVNKKGIHAYFNEPAKINRMG